MSYKRTRLTIEEKQEIIRRVRAKEATHEDIMQEYGISINTVKTIFRYEDAIMDAENAPHSKLHPKKLNLTPRPKPEDRKPRAFYTLDFVDKDSRKDMKVLRSTALYPRGPSDILSFIAPEMVSQCTEFLKALQIAMGIIPPSTDLSSTPTSLMHPDPSIPVNPASAAHLTPFAISLSSLPQNQLSMVAPQDVYAVDHTALLYSCLPESKADYLSMRTSINRKIISVILCCNADGSNLLSPHFVVLPSSMTSQQSAEARRRNIYYDTSPETALKPEYFHHWLLHFDAQMTRPSVLIVPTSPSYKIDPSVFSRLRFTRIIQTPVGPHTSIHPIASGIHMAFKSLYRYETVDTLSHRFDMFRTEKHIPPESINEIKEISIMDAFFLSQVAWSRVSPSSIVKCWVTSGIFEPAQLGYGTRVATDNCDGLIEVVGSLQKLSLLDGRFRAAMDFTHFVPKFLAIPEIVESLVPNGSPMSQTYALDAIRLASGANSSSGTSDDGAPSAPSAPSAPRAKGKKKTQAPNSASFPMGDTNPAPQTPEP
eukprot:TRINITY_DN4369_c0_g1_i1.p1 TRINITY_DN4369_c0_g1~~TRINITY_DN4369_c0_g1_i1.p1  ORF type:complete len:539 (+),score=121.59 TRINITY_DN4369_c0_g1_i1:52-1668(+)